jgi:hypothetical protein
MPPTTISADEVVVPMSTILDALEGVLTDAEQQALFAQLIVVRPGEVAPGDLITAKLFNDMSKQLGDLTLRVTKLESSALEAQIPIITGILPNPATVGTDMTISGENLTPKFLTRIEIGDSRINIGQLKIGSSPTQLVFSTPSVTGATPAGIPVFVKVVNEAGEAQSSCVIKSGIAANLSGNVDVQLTGVTPAGALAQNTDYTYAFDIEIESSHAETFTVEPILTVTPSTGWSAVMATGAEVSVPVSSGAPVKRQVTVTVHTGGNNGAGTLVIRLKGKTFTSFQRSSGGFPVAVNAESEPTDGPIQFQAPSISGDATMKAIRSGNIEITKATLSGGTTTQKTIRLTVPLTIEATGNSANYAMSVATAADPGGGANDWTATLTSGSQITQSAAGGDLSSITATITANNANPANGKVTVTVTGAGALPDASFNLGLRAVDQISA